MDHTGLKISFLVQRLSCLALSLICVGACASHKEAAAPSPSRSLFERLEMPYVQAVRLTRDSLLWIQGMELDVEDLERGIFVSEWQMQSARERYRITVRVQSEYSKRGEAGLVSVNAEEQILSDSGWRDTPSTGLWEQQTLKAIHSRYQASLGVRSP